MGFSGLSCKARREVFTNWTNDGICNNPVGSHGRDSSRERVKYYNVTIVALGGLMLLVPWLNTSANHLWVAIVTSMLNSYLQKA